MNLSAGLAQVARRAPESPAVIWDGGELGYAAFEDQAARIAGALRQRHGLRPGAHVGMAMENAPEFLPVLYGIWRAGMAAVPINAKLHPREMAWILENAGAPLCIATPKVAEALGGVTGVPPIVATGSRDYAALLAGERVERAESRPDDAAWIFYTSGTTGRPKGAVLTHRNLTAMSLIYLADVDRVGAGDMRLHAAPMSHGSGLYALPFVMQGAANLIHPGFEPERVFEALEHHDKVSFFAAPTMVMRLVNHPAAREAPGLKTLCYGGAPMYLADLKRALALFGPRLYQLYGQGECPMTITHVTKAMHGDEALPRRDEVLPRRDEVLASAGFPRSATEVAIVDEEWRELPFGEPGEIAVRSDCVMAGYLGNREATAETLRDGWLKTGDVGIMDPMGFVTLKDRSKDLIISGGANIYPREVEEVLLTAEGVAEVAVVGRAHPDWGEEVVAFVVPRSGAEPDPAALERHCLAHMARFKRPRLWRFVGELPKNNYGKVLKTALREALEREET